jgi:hypothetical protein
VTLHIDIPTRSEVESLLRVRGSPCVSIYVATTPLPHESQPERIELKNLVAEAAGQIEAARPPRGTVEQVREPLDELVEDDEFWATQARSLAVFASPTGLRTFRLPNRLTSGVEVADRFYVKPLLRAVTFSQAGFVLAIAAGSVRLVEVAGDGPPFTVNVTDLPASAASGAGKSSIADRSPSRRIQGSEGQKVLLRQYARKVDHALRGVLTGLELPLILAATEPLESIYRSVNSYPQLAETGIQGSPEGSSDEELAAAARPVLDELHARQLSELRERFEQSLAQDRASADVATVARAATYGAVDTVIVDVDQKVPGFVDDESGAVTFAEEDDAVSYGVVDEILRRVVLMGGRVFAVRAPDVPGDGPVAAILRYAI